MVGSVICALRHPGGGRGPRAPEHLARPGQVRGAGEQLADSEARALATEYRRIELQLLERWDAPLINDFLCMMAFGASRKLMQRWAGQAGPTGLHAASTPPLAGLV